MTIDDAARSVLYRGGRLYCPAVPGATALLVREGRIAWVGVDADAPGGADRVVELGGALVTPAFVDAHVHATATGLTVSGLGLSEVSSADGVLAAVAAAAAGLPGDAVVLGHGWDDSRWVDARLPSAAELDRAADGRRVYLSQASMHAALCSAALLAAVPAIAGEPGYEGAAPEAEGAAPGVQGSALVRRQAHHAVRSVALGSVPAVQRTAAQRAMLRVAAAAGVAAVHECGGPQISAEDDFVGLLALSGAGLPEVYGYWGELSAAGKARELGAVGAGGDLFADGALGSRTAHLSGPYADGPGCGFGYLSVEQVAGHLVDCAGHGVQGGFHAIGDAAVTTVLGGFAAAARVLGVDRLRAGRHRVEHAELLTKALIAGFVEFGVVASVQPAFDRLWGGPEQMYARRLGVSRAVASNPFAALHAVGVTLAFGSDSPVTPVDPWGSVRAAVWHHEAGQRLGVRAAFAAHTRGGWRAVHRDGEGALAPGAAATFAVWDCPAGVVDGLPVLLAAEVEARGPLDPTPLPVCRRTVLRGATIFEE